MVHEYITVDKKKFIWVVYQTPTVGRKRLHIWNNRKQIYIRLLKPGEEVTTEQVKEIIRELMTAK